VNNRDWLYEPWLVAVVSGANAVPLVGIAVLGWDLLDVIVLYYLEWGGAVLASLVAACPARLVRLPVSGRREGKLDTRRGATRVLGLPCRPRNARVLTVLVVVGAGFWTVVGVIPFLLSEPPVSPTSRLTPPVILVGGLLGVTHLLAVRAYLRAGRERRRTPERAARPGLGLTLAMGGFVALVGVLVSERGAQAFDGLGGVVPAVLVLGKLGVELRLRCRYRPRQRLDDGEDPFAFQPDLTARSSPVAELPAVADPGVPRATVRPDRRTLLLLSPLFSALVGTGRLVLVGFGLAGLGGLVLVAGSAPLLAVALVGVGLLFTFVPGLVLLWLRDSALEYRLYDDRVVCYDRRLDAAQWSLPYDRIRSVEVDRTALHRLGDAGAVVVETYDGTPARLRAVGAYRETAAFLDPTGERTRVDTLGRERR
jgi:hypothetical protein